MTAVIRFKPLDSEWATLGTERFRGVVAEGIEASSNLWGPDQLGFNIKTVEPAALRPDLLPYTPIELEVDGMLVWAGRIKARPSTEVDHQVQCEGWQYHLDDDDLDRVWVHTRVGDYRDLRTYLTADLTRVKVQGQVQNDNGVTVIGWGDGSKCGNNDAVGILLDLGPDSLCKRLVLEWDRNCNNSSITCYGRGVNTEEPFAGASEDYFSFTVSSASPGFISGTAGTPRRYVCIMLVYSGIAQTFAAEQVLRIKSIKAFRDTAFESGNASILKADQIVTDLLPFAPQLNQSSALISAGTFSIPESLTAGYQSPREVWDGVNAFENYRCKIGGSDLRTAVFDVKPTAPLFEAGEWSGSTFADASMAGDEIYTRAIVDATGPDGARLVSTRTQTGTLADRNGTVRSKVLPIRSAVTQAVADRFGDLWLTEHKTAPFAGKLAATNGIRRLQGGATVPAHALLIHAGEKIRLAHRLDPDTGGWGRDGRIAGVTYRHDARSVDIDIDDRRGNFDEVLSRYASLVDQLP